MAPLALSRQATVGLQVAPAPRSARRTSAACLASRPRAASGTPPQLLPRPAGSFLRGSGVLAIAHRTAVGAIARPTERYAPRASATSPDISKFQRHRYALGNGKVLEASVFPNAAGGTDVSLVVRPESQNEGSPAAPDQSLCLHWGVVYAGTGGWSVPPQRSWPPETVEHKKRALKTWLSPDLEAGTARLRIHTEPDARELIFVLHDDQNNWFNAPGGGDFRITLREPAVSDELIQVAAYLLWEEQGKPPLGRDAQQELFKCALDDLKAQYAEGLALSTVEERLLGPPPPPVKAATPPAAKPKRERRRSPSPPPARLPHIEKPPPEAAAPAGPPPREVTVHDVPEEMIQVRAYVRWEEGGKRELSAQEQMQEFERARQEMWDEVSIGATLEELQAWLDKGPFGERPSQWIKNPARGGAASAPGPSSASAPAPAPAPARQHRQPHTPRTRHSVSVDDLFGVMGDALHVGGVAHDTIGAIAGSEGEAQKSFMHRYNIATGILRDESNRDSPEGVAAVAVWLRYTAMKQLVWNKDYNIKPRELSAAQLGLTDHIVHMYENQRQYRELCRLMLQGVGRGGEGDVGQRIRDEILVIQRQNDCMGGMMEEWHQKLHNNTTPDDVVICDALIQYLEANCDIGVYWRVLEEGGIDRERLLSYDRAIHSEPDLGGNRDKRKLIRDLEAYQRTLKAVHSGADLQGAMEAVLGYDMGECKGKRVSKSPVPEVANDGELVGLLEETLDRSIAERGENPEGTLVAAVEARRRLLHLVSHGCGDLRRHKDIIYLDLGLDLAVKLAIEQSASRLSTLGVGTVVNLLSLALENMCLSTPDNHELVLTLKELHAARGSGTGESQALRLKAVLDRAQVALAASGERLYNNLQSTANELGGRLGCDGWAIDTFTEEVIRSSGAAAVSILIGRLGPLLREIADLGNWQVISPVEVTGQVVAVDRLIEIQDDVFLTPTVVVANRVSGEEEIPEGAVAVVTTDMPDVLSHVSVRARNEGVCFATCFDTGIFSDLQSKDGHGVTLTPQGPGELSIADAHIEIKATPTETIHAPQSSAPTPNISITRRRFAGQYVLTWDQYRPEAVGAKSRHVASLRGMLPPWVNLPASVALPFGTFEELLKQPINREAKAALDRIVPMLENDLSLLEEARAAAATVRPTPAASQQIMAAMQEVGLPMPADMEKAWAAAAKVWASKWNDRAYISCRKVGIDHRDLCMAVLIQEVVQPKYAFVVHTVNPQTGNDNEVYVELVKGLGETLVGAYPGRAMSFVAAKDNPRDVRLLGYPSKSVALQVPETLIFRSDSNGEDLEGYAGAGLYDSVTMDDQYEEGALYAEDAIMYDEDYARSVMVAIAEASVAIEDAFGAPQDIEGVIKEDGSLYIVQTRPQV
mmetsp:Transcript_13764/g.50112  ORF Transcript_13764/g.50112 Transcript_13764/m.50112 type:complete len:1383 (-) Transcript_13764:628-4776(-)